MGDLAESATASPTSTRVRALDGLRGVAVLAVLLFHGGFLTGGYLGVDAFFVLSGFLITTLLLREWTYRGRVDLAEFWSRRARRLLPALFLFVMGVALYARFWAARTDYARIRHDAIGTLLYVANWQAIFAGHGYFDLFRAPSPFDHAWSLAVEEQFYLVWPLVVVVLGVFLARAARRERHREVLAPAVGAAACIGALMSAAWLMLHYDAANPSRVYLGSDTRIGAILLGAAVAAAMVWRGPVAGRRAQMLLQAASLVAVIGLAVAWVRLDGQGGFLYRGGLALCGIAVAVVVLAAAQPEPGPLGRMLAWRPLVAVGLVSYGVYLWHWLVYLVLDEGSFGVSGIPLLAVRIAVTFALAVASYTLVERPIRHLPARPTAVLLASTAALVLCLATLFLATTGGASTSGSAGGLLTGKARLEVDAARSGSDRTRRVLVVGDSVAGIIGGASVEQAPGLGLQAGTAAMPGCQLAGVTSMRATGAGAADGTPIAQCETTWMKGVRQFEPGVVILLYGVVDGFVDLEIDGQWISACDTAFHDWYVDALERVVRQMGRDVRVLLEIMPPAVTTNDAEMVNTRISCLNADHRELARTLPGVGLADVSALACPADHCRDTLDGEEFRIDPVHYSPPAARFLARALLRQAVPTLDEAPVTSP